MIDLLKLANDFIFNLKGQRKSQNKLITLPGLMLILSEYVENTVET